MRARLPLLVVLLFLFRPGALPHFRLPSNYFPLGINGGCGTWGPVIGGEVSYVHVSKMRDFAWGIYGDWVHASRGERFSLGPEIMVPLEISKSVLFIGADGGPLVRVRRGRAEGGFTTRIFFVLYAIPYLRYTYTRSEHVVEYGALIKVPIPGWD